MNSGFLRGELRRLLVDTLVVLIGVLAALVLNNIREDMLAERAARVATERLVQEVANNTEELRDAREVVQRRLSKLGKLQGDIPPGKSLKELVLQFNGFWSVNLNASSWEYLSRGALADSVDPQLLQDAIVLYKTNGSFDRLNDQIQSFVYSEAFVSPDKASAALEISETIMLQQLNWVDWLLPQYESFLERYGAQGRAAEAAVAPEKVSVRH